MEFIRADVFEGVRPKRLAPERLRRLPERFNRPTVQYDLTFGIPTHKRAPADDVKRRGPDMRVHGSAVASFDARIKHSHRVVLEEKHMMRRRRAQRVQLRGPKT